MSYTFEIVLLNDRYSWAITVHYRHSIQYLTPRDPEESLFDTWDEALYDAMAYLKNTQEKPTITPEDLNAKWN